MKQRPFAQVDVFTAVPYLGNPLAVVLDGSGLSTAQMQAFTDWTNLSEATFVLPPTQPDADYAVRIFCPGRELPFAGHPTLGTCHAWLESGPDTPWPCSSHQLSGLAPRAAGRPLGRRTTAKATPGQQGQRPDRLPPRVARDV